MYALAKLKKSPESSTESAPSGATRTSGRSSRRPPGRRNPARPTPQVNFPTAPRPRAAVSRKSTGGFVVVQDTREQLGYCDWSEKPFGRAEPTPYVIAKLDAGDYSIQGYETQVAVERKRPAELFTCFTTERQRFRREFELLSTYRFAAVVIEGDLPDVATRYNTWTSRGEIRVGTVNPHVVVNSLISWSIEYGVHIIYAHDRAMAMAYTYRILEKFAAKVSRETPPPAAPPPPPPPPPQPPITG